MPIYRVQTSLQDKSGLPRDQYVNTVGLYMSSAMDDSAIAAIGLATSGFYSGLNAYWSQTIAQNGHHTKAYLVGAPLDSPPAKETTWNMTNNPAGTPLPAEVASCLSFHADPQPGVPRQSWRGRIYLGPLGTGAMGTSSAQVGRPANAYISDVMLYAGYYLEALNAVGDLVIISKARSKAFRVATYSMDDAFDTQRSRGNRPTRIEKATLASGGGIPIQLGS